MGRKRIFVRMPQGIAKGDRLAVSIDDFTDEVVASQGASVRTIMWQFFKALGINKDALDQYNIYEIHTTPDGKHSFSRLQNNAIAKANAELFVQRKDG